MTILTTYSLDIPAIPIPGRSHDQVIRDPRCDERPVMRRRIRLDGNGFPARADRIVPVPYPIPSNVPDSKIRQRRSWLCLVERALRDSPANLRTTLVVLVVFAVLVGIMVATLGMFAIGVLIGLAIMYKPLCVHDRSGRVADADMSGLREGERMSSDPTPTA